MVGAKPIEVGQLPAQIDLAGVTLGDSHCHIHLDEFTGDIESVLTNARSRGIKNILLIGAAYGLSGNEKALELAQTDDELWVSIGLHPHDANEWNTETLPQLLRWQRENAKKVVAIGETGLDFHYENSSRDNQKTAFTNQLALAEELQLPFTIHTRNAFDETFAVLKDFRDHIGKFGGIIHCFSEGVREAEAYLELGLHLSMSGIVTLPKAVEVREALKIIPIEKLLLETDSPFLTPQPMRGRRNEPACMLWTVQSVAEVLKLSVAEVARQTTANASELLLAR